MASIYSFTVGMHMAKCTIYLPLPVFLSSIAPIVTQWRWMVSEDSLCHWCIRIRIFRGTKDARRHVDVTITNTWWQHVISGVGQNAHQHVGENLKMGPFVRVVVPTEQHNLVSVMMKILGGWSMCDHSLLRIHGCIVCLIVQWSRIKIKYWGG